MMPSGTPYEPSLGTAIDTAARYDQKILVEEGIPAREIECAVLGNADPEASVVGEVIPCKEFYDYEAKYLMEGSELIIIDRPGSIACLDCGAVRDVVRRDADCPECDSPRVMVAGGDEIKLTELEVD